MVPRKEEVPASGRPQFQRRDVRRLAMQLLYQVDMGGITDADALLTGIDPDVGPLELRRQALDLALAAWEQRHAADQIAVELAPDWPTHRQPPVDRAILRLAYYEMASGHAPPKVAINEAIELAKVFCAENAPAFLNGILDKMAKRLEPPQPPTLPTAPEPPAANELS